MPQWPYLQGLKWISKSVIHFSESFHSDGYIRLSEWAEKVWFKTFTNEWEWILFWNPFDSLKMNRFLRVICSRFGHHFMSCACLSAKHCHEIWLIWTHTKVSRLYFNLFSVLFSFFFFFIAFAATLVAV